MEKINEDHFNNPVVIILLLILLGVIGYLLFGKKQETSNTYYFPQGSFSAYFPKQPTFKTDTQKLLSNEKSVLDDMYYVNDADGNMILSVVYVSSAFTNTDKPEENLNNEVTFTGNIGSGPGLVTNTSINATTYNGIPAINYKACNHQPTQWCDSGVDILKGNDLYEIQYYYKVGEEDKTLEKTFLNSVAFGEQPNGSIIVNPTTNNTVPNPSQVITVPTTTDTTAQPPTTEPVPTVTVPATLSLPKIISKWSPNVALILCNYSDGTADFGSGFLYYDRTIGVSVYTNKHVFTEETSGDSAISCSLQIPGDSQYYTVTNPSTNNNQFEVGNNDDWGFMEIANGDSYFNKVAKKSLTICQKQEQTGDNVVVLGYPDYAGQFTNPTATQGIISGYASPYYTTSAQIESGNSGGVAIDPDKDCYIGIPSAVKLGNYSNLGRILNADVLFNVNY